MPRVKYAMDHRPKNSFSMSYASRKVIFPGVLLVQRGLRIGRIPLARRKFRPTGYQSKGIGGREDSRNLSREKHC